MAVTLGDPRGIGPEIIAKALTRNYNADIVAIGPASLLEGLPCEVMPVDDSSLSPPATEDWSAESAGTVTGRAIETAAKLALSGSVHGIVTGPAEKKALHAAGHRFPGHTEFLAHLAGGAEVVMMLVTGKLRVALVTTHVPLRDVPSLLTTEAVVRTGKVTREYLGRWFGLKNPRLAVCALNPHGGEGGLFGTEEIDVLDEAARVLNATGPVPADTVFVRAFRGECDAVLTPYHDVGMTAVKVAGFGKGVNVTLGLPFVRTAPDHGTAFDIAGRGVADPSSMIEAIALGVALTRRNLSRA